MPKPVVSENLILLDGVNPAASAADVISRLCALLQVEGYVGPGYLPVVLDREARFPTALPTQPFATAIPHGDPVDVHESGVAVAVLDQPIPFGSMDTPGESLPVRAVLLMAIAHASQQVPTLQWVCQMLSRPDLVERLVQARTPAQVMELLRPIQEADRSGG